MSHQLTRSLGICFVPVLITGVLMAGVLGFGTPPAQAQGVQPIVIEGGTLIDGNGGPPIPNAIVVIEGNMITAAGAADDVDVPAGAEIIDASGKWVLPGLWDAQSNYSSMWGELFPYFGVTSYIDVGLGGEVSIASRDAVNRGLQIGPREFIGIAHFGRYNESNISGYETLFDGWQYPRSLEELQEASHRLLDAGADMLMFHDGSWPFEWVEWGCNEVHSRGKPCFQRSDGPNTGTVEAARAGVDVVHHSRGVDLHIVREGAEARNTLERFAQMDDAKAEELIQILVDEEVNLVPNIINDAPGYPADWPQMQDVYHELFSNPAVLSYYQPAFLNRLRMTRANTATSELREQRMVGYQNLLRFYRDLDAAGGKVLIGGDTNGSKVPGSIVHEEMAIFREAGIPAMHIIQGATSWVAEAMRVDDWIGTVAPDKVADILIVNADPLADVRNLRQIDSVIQNGRVLDRTLHSSLNIPLHGLNTDERYTIPDRFWVRALKAEHRGPNAFSSPQPAIEAIAPTMAVQGTPITLTITGFNFVDGSQVFYGDIPVPFERTSPTELSVTLDQNLMGRAGRIPITVKNPGPMQYPIWGDGTSNPAYLVVRFK